MLFTETAGARLSLHDIAGNQPGVTFAFLRLHFTALPCSRGIQPRLALKINRLRLGTPKPAMASMFSSYRFLRQVVGV